MPRQAAEFAGPAPEARKSVIDALLGMGIRHWDMSLVRNSLRMRWHDCSARSLLNDPSCGARPLFSSGSVRTLDTRDLLPGDFVVTSDGVHALAYLGDGAWIAADPGAGKVIRLGATDNNEWLGVPVTALRRSILEDSNGP